MTQQTEFKIPDHVDTQHRLEMAVMRAEAQFWRQEAMDLRDTLNAMAVECENRNIALISTPSKARLLEFTEIHQPDAGG